MGKSILFITTSSLSTNPRLLKEMLLAKENKFTPIFVGFSLGNWSDELDNQIIENYQLKYVYRISASKTPFLPWLLSSLIEKASKNVYTYSANNIRLASYASSKRSFLLLKFLESSELGADFIVSHNIGALYPAFVYSTSHNIPFAFDVEDYHPGEMTFSGDQVLEKLMREVLMQKLLPKASYITYASPLIGKYTLKLIGEYSSDKHILVPNTFPSHEFSLPLQDTIISSTVNIIWFSQNITLGRGLELVVPVLRKYKNQIRLTLIGNNTGSLPTFMKYDDLEWVQIISPLPQKELHAVLANFDIGLACELSDQDLNKEIAVSNKIYAYAQAGLFILATDTLAQIDFLKKLPKAGKIVSQDEDSVSLGIEELIKNIDVIRAERRNRYEEASKLSWDVEKQRLLLLWNSI